VTDEPPKPPESPFPPADYGKLRPVGEVLTPKKIEELARESSGVKSMQGSLKYVLGELANAGFKRVVSDHVLSGSSALVLEANNHQMIRIVDARDAEKARSKDDDVLQPVNVIPVMGHRVEILPKVHSLLELIKHPEIAEKYGLRGMVKVAETFLRRLIVENLHKGKFFFDPSISNVGVIQDINGQAVPVIIDSGAVVERAGAGTICDLNFISRCNESGVFSEYMGMYPNRTNKTPMEYLEFLATQSYPDTLPYAEAQAEHLKRLGLEKGKPNGAVGRSLRDQFVRERMDDMEKRYARDPAEYGRHPERFIPPWRAAYPTMVDYGWYQGELTDIVREAAKAVGENPPRERGVPVVIGDPSRPGFCQHMKRIHEERVKAALPKEPQK
jgi:hypothetical protein